MNIKIGNTDFLNIEKMRCGVRNVDIAKRLGVSGAYVAILIRNPHQFRIYQINILSVLFGWDVETKAEFIRDCGTEKNGATCGA